MTDKKKIPLYITIAETEEQGAEITTRYIMDKYGVTCSKSQSAIRILDNAGVISAGERRNGIKIVYTVLPGASEKIAAYVEQKGLCMFDIDQTQAMVRAEPPARHNPRQKDF